MMASLDGVVVGDLVGVRPPGAADNLTDHVAAVRGGHAPRTDRARVGVLVVAIVTRDGHLAALALAYSSRYHSSRGCLLASTRDVSGQVMGGVW